ncbi:phosphoribosylglycinamide synthetase [Streptomyces sp. ISL-66]|uniref:ATP-grasp domain-containing protein n=1 Tax=Streptomyces sp. ISL-66 TaxID=2819186 RepID=UPI0027E59F55|nr:phosphoribosylglycinamide synthetase [Streptomyces sp. ISL-66]
MTGPRCTGRLLMVMPYEELVRKAVEAGFRVWSIWDPKLRPAAYLDRVAANSEELALADFDDEAALRALVARMAEENCVQHVLHLGGDQSGPAPVPAGARAEAEALGLSAGGEQSVRLLNDRNAMRRLLNRNGVSVVRVREAATYGEVGSLLREFGLPAVVKPVNSPDGQGAALVRTDADLAQWAEPAGSAGPAALEGPFTVEDFLEGPEFSVETLTVDGMHLVAGITAKGAGAPTGPAGTVGPAEPTAPAAPAEPTGTTGATGITAPTGTTGTTGTTAPTGTTGPVPGPAPLGEVEEGAIRATVAALLDLAGYEFGPAHTEVVLTRTGPRIRECRARLGGDRDPLRAGVATAGRIPGAHPAPPSSTSTPAPKEALR